MDADYLKANLHDPLTEALAAMAAKVPDDKVEFIGQYLLQFVERQKIKERKENENNLANLHYHDEVIKNKKLEEEKQVIKKAEENQFQKFPNFIEILKTQEVNSKQDAMNNTTAFISDFFDVNAHIAMKKVVGDSEYLYYLSSSQDAVIGKKLLKVLPDGDDIIPRQGISFDSFILPDIPEQEEELDENGDPKPAPPPPKPQPLIIDNVMREKRIKFFGIPKLGSYAAIPFSYPTLDHDQGCIPLTADEIAAEVAALIEAAAIAAAEAQAAKEEAGDESNAKVEETTATIEENVEPEVIDENSLKSLYRETKIPQDFIIGIDTIGKYRRFKPSEIAMIQEIGSTLVIAFEEYESKLLVTQKQYIDIQKLQVDKINDILNDLNQNENDVLIPLAPTEGEAEVVTKPPEEDVILEDEDGNPIEPPPPPPESLKPFEDSVKILKYWSNGILNSSLQNSILSLQAHLIPLPAPALNLLIAILTLCRFDMKEINDIFGEVSWYLLRERGITALPELLSSYDPNQREVTMPQSFNEIRGYIDTTGIFEGGASILPPYLPIFQVLLTWLQKAFASREAAITYYRDANDGSELEIVVTTNLPLSS